MRTILFSTCVILLSHFACAETIPSQWEIREAILQDNDFDFKDERVKKINDSYLAYFKKLFENRDARDTKSPDPMIAAINLAVCIGEKSTIADDIFSSCTQYDEIALAVQDLESIFPHTENDNSELEILWKKNLHVNDFPTFTIMNFILIDADLDKKDIEGIVCGFVHHLDGSVAEPFYDNIGDNETLDRDKFLMRLVEECKIIDPKTGYKIFPRYTRAKNKPKENTEPVKIESKETPNPVEEDTDD